jgi:transaldolase/glucose-6-phosphate isomerase
MTSGDLDALLDLGIRGMTANPSIFEKAIAGSTDYDPALRSLVDSGAGVAEIYEALAVEDVQLAADILRPIYEQSHGIDGRVSIEVSPKLAGDTEGMIEEARRLYRAIDRPNAFIKIPATPAGIPAIRQLLIEGIDINVTLIFAIEVYEQVMAAYLDALKQRVERGRPIDRLTSVASFFVSRVDSEVDARLVHLIAAEPNGAKRASLEGLLGKAAIANAKLAYARFESTFGSDWFRRLRDEGARLQRPLWASTGTKNPNYGDVRYVEELIGPETVNTMPPQTIEAFLDHGRVERTIDTGLDDARATIEQLEAFGISMTDVTDRLLADGIRLFTEAFERLESAIAAKREVLLSQAGRRAVASGARAGDGR